MNTDLKLFIAKGLDILSPEAHGKGMLFKDRKTTLKNLRWLWSQKEYEDFIDNINLLLPTELLKILDLDELRSALVNRKVSKEKEILKWLKRKEFYIEDDDIEVPKKEEWFIKDFFKYNYSRKSFLKNLNAGTFSPEEIDEYYKIHLQLKEEMYNPKDK